MTISRTSGERARVVGFAAVMVARRRGHVDLVPLPDLRAVSGRESRGPAGTAVRERRPSICDDIATDPRMEIWREAALARGYRACGGFPLVREGTAIGALVV